MTLQRRSSFGTSKGQWYSGMTNWLGRTFTPSSDWSQEELKAAYDQQQRQPGWQTMLGVGGANPGVSVNYDESTGLYHPLLQGVAPAVGTPTGGAGNFLTRLMAPETSWLSRLGNLGNWWNEGNLAQKAGTAANFLKQAPGSIKLAGAAAPLATMGVAIANSGPNAGSPEATTQSGGRPNRTTTGATVLDSGVNPPAPGTEEGADDPAFQTYLNRGGMMNYKQWQEMGSPEVDKPIIQTINGRDFLYSIDEYGTVHWTPLSALDSGNSSGQSLSDQLALMYAQNPYLYWAQLGQATPDAVARLTGGRVKGGQALSGPAALGNLQLPSAQWWGGLNPSEQQQVLGAVNWLGMNPDDWLSLMQKMSPASRERMGATWGR